MPTKNDFDEIWNDQLEFNNQFRANPAPTFEERTAETKELVLHLISECDELLRASGAWKLHRRVPTLENREAVRLELADIFKYTMTVAQVHGISLPEFIDSYWKKSMVVRQRYSEEFVHALHQPSVIVDIDNVLADYVEGFLTWYCQRCRFIPVTQPRYIDADTLGLGPTQYQAIRHDFRTSGRHAHLPVMSGAREFLQWVFQEGWQIILITARPIDRYPNLHAETLAWLERNELHHDVVWWARDKGELIVEREVKDHIVFAVDDEWQYVNQLAQQCVQTFWLTDRPQPPDPYIDVVASLADIPKKYESFKRGVVGDLS